MNTFIDSFKAKKIGKCKIKSVQNFSSDEVIKDGLNQVKLKLFINMIESN